MKPNLKVLTKDLKLFFSDWYRLVFRQIYKVFSRFERVKGAVAQVLYRQRGRFARPFVLSAMGGLVAMAVVLAPVLANSFPGIEQNQGEELLPSSQIMQVTDTGTTTEVSDKVRDKVLEYIVQPGDTVSGIADKFGVSEDTIKWENSLKSVDAIRPGHVIRVLPVTGMRHKVTRGETIYTIAKKYEANPQAIVDFPFNTFKDNENFSLDVGQELIVPEGKKPADPAPWSPRTPSLAQRTPDAGVVSALGQFVWPMGGRLTQNFSWYHRGLDIATSHGTPVLAADAGRVTVASWKDNSGYGIQVMIDHGNGYATRYAHLSKVSVTVGQSVNRGDVVGLEGSTGRSTGPHLHFEIFKNGVQVNPRLFLK